MSTITTVNPANGQNLKSYRQSNQKEIADKIGKSWKAFLDWKKISIADRGKLFGKAADILGKNKTEYAVLMAKEMGKPVKLGQAEVEKCAWICRYYAQNTNKFLKNETVITEAKSSFVTFEPLGIVLAVMPWNYPFNQVFRFAVPALMAGNAGLLKHASNVTGCSLAIEEIFKLAGFPKYVFQSLVISSADVSGVINDNRVKAVTLTGSEKAGSSVAEAAGKNLKKSVMELGGSDPFIVLDDADLDKTVSVAANARLMNSGQVCICAKRFIVQQNIAGEFTAKLTEKFQKIVIGDPVELKTEMGPMTNMQILETIDGQVKKSVKLGAKIITGGKRLPREGYFYAPTILTGISAKMPVYNEETFGPVAVILPFKTDDEAVRIANDTRYGLGASVWTKNRKRAEKFIRELSAGCVFVNAQVRSDPRLPFGGTKSSGYGRELSSYGIREFVNIKTVWMD